MSSYLVVALGGAVGALCRYSVSRLFLVSGWSELMIYSTTAVNMVGCFLMGFLVAGSLDPKGWNLSWSLCWVSWWFHDLFEFCPRMDPSCSRRPLCAFGDSLGVERFWFGRLLRCRIFWEEISPRSLILGDISDSKII